MRFMKNILGTAAVLIMFTCTVCCAQSDPGYEALLFDTGVVHTIEIEVAEEDWEDLIAHPEEKTKYEADLVIDGEPVEQVSFSAKGNSSLAFIKYSGISNRYSFKVNFGKYVKGQKWHGLDKLNLQDCFADAAYMKDYLAYRMFREMDVPAPLCSYVFLKINGEDFGLYLAVEEMEDSFLERISDGSGTLYKPEWNEPELNEERINAIKSGKSFGATEVCGSDLVYIDDEPDSYPDIFDNVVTKRDPDSEARVINALKALKEGEDLESVLDTDEIIRYFAVHNFLMNYDGYIGRMLHNYYLYDHDGKLQMMPWDYNLAYGTFPMSGNHNIPNDPDVIVNKGIDTPLFGPDIESRPMWGWIASDEETLARYHAALEKLISGQFDSGDFVGEIDRVHELIQPYIALDRTAFYTPEEAEQAYEVIRELLILRAESIRRQLSGELAADDDLQEEADRVDASMLGLPALGSSDLD